jgi:hypothetical protein
MVVPTHALRLFLRLSIKEELEGSGVPFALPTPDELDSFIQRASMRIPLGPAETLEMFVRIKEQIHKVYSLVDGLLRELVPNDEALKSKMAKIIEELEGITTEIYLSDAEFRGEFEETFQDEHGIENALLSCLAQDGLLVDSSVKNFDQLPPDTRTRFLSMRK